MWKRRRTWILLVAVTAVALAVYFEPTHCVRGWLRGEAFYDGRPTSFWAAEVQQWEVTGGGGNATCWDEYYSRRPRWPRWTEQFFAKAEWPKLFNGDPDGLPVLRELRNHRSPEVQDWARVGIERAESQDKWDKGPYKHGSNLPDT